MKQFVLVVLLVLSFNPSKCQSLKVMLVTGGHAFDTTEFFQMFDAFEGIEYDHFAQPEANQEIAKGTAEKYDMLVFYDMWKKISEREKAAYIQLTKQGMPMLFLHHSIASYQKWKEFESIIGGKYFEQRKGVSEELWSTYEHDVWLYCSIDNPSPITTGIREFRFFDEAYGNVRISDNVRTLLRTKHPKSIEYVAWKHVYNNSNIVYIQPGHDKRTYENKEYRKLLFQAMKYLAITN